MNKQLVALAHKGGIWTRASLRHAGFTDQHISEAVSQKLLETKLNGTMTVATRARNRLIEQEQLNPGDTVMRIVNGQLKPFQVVGDPSGGKISLIDPEDPVANVEQVNQDDITSQDQQEPVQPQNVMQPIKTESRLLGLLNSTGNQPVAESKSLAERLLGGLNESTPLDAIIQALTAAGFTEILPEGDRVHADGEFTDTGIQATFIPLSNGEVRLVVPGYKHDLEAGEAPLPEIIEIAKSIDSEWFEEYDWSDPDFDDEPDYNDDLNEGFGRGGFRRGSQFGRGRGTGQPDLGQPRPQPGQNLNDWAHEVNLATLEELNYALEGLSVVTGNGEESVIEEVLDDEQGIGAKLENGLICYLHDLTAL